MFLDLPLKHMEDLISAHRQRLCSFKIFVALQLINGIYGTEIVLCMGGAAATTRGVHGIHLVISLVSPPCVNFFAGL